MSILRHLRVFAVALPLYGCIVVVSPFDVGEHCGIAGESACAECLRKTCQAPIDACCKSTTCSGPAVGLVTPILEAVDDCGRGDKNACVSATSSVRTATEDEAVRACVTTECKADCTDGGTPTKPIDATWTCETPRAASTACGACIYEGCATALDECCADSTCGKYSGVSKELSACISGDAPGCVYAQKKGSTTGLEGVVRACIQKKCAEKCFGDGLAHQNCQLYSGGRYCTCSDAEKSGGPECSVKKVGGRCALSNDGCVCGEYSCDGARDSCECDFRGGGGSTSCGAGTDEDSRCCLHLDDSVSCSCSPFRDCASRHEYEVSSCNLANVLGVLASASRLVDTCSR